MGLYNYTSKQIEKMLHKKEISAEEIADLSLKQIQADDDDIKAFLTVNEENVKAHAKKKDEENRYDKKLAANQGAIKDNIVTKGIRPNSASQMLADFDDPLYDATVKEKLATEDALMVGKVNLDEFAMGSSTETSSFQKTSNSWNLDYVPGGSSGGSAAAVAAGEV